MPTGGIRLFRFLGTLRWLDFDQLYVVPIAEFAAFERSIEPRDSHSEIKVFYFRRKAKITELSWVLAESTYSLVTDLSRQPRRSQNPAEDKGHSKPCGLG